MRGILVGALAALLIFAAMPSHANIEIDPGTLTPGSSISGNDFQSDLDAGGFNWLAEGAELIVSSAGTFTFYALGSESGFTNSFNVDGSGLFTESNEGWPGSLTANEIGTYDVLAPTTLSGNVFNFTSSGHGNTHGIGTDEFGIYFQGGGGLDPILTGHLGIIFAYDDNGAGPDDNHDDLMIYALFTPSTVVPEPATWMMMILGFGLVGTQLQRRKQVIAG